MIDHFIVDVGWQKLLEDFGLESEKVLHAAGLPHDLFSQAQPTLTTQEYFRLWDVFMEATAAPDVPLKLGVKITEDNINPFLYAVFSSPNLRVALQRLHEFKRLICPMKLSIQESSQGYHYRFDMLDPTLSIPHSLLALELVFIVNMARIATQKQIIPDSVVVLQAMDSRVNYKQFFGIKPLIGEQNSICFSHADLDLPFMTVNSDLWRQQEPELRQKLHKIDNNASIASRVRSVLIELLPDGKSSLNDVAGKLLISKRTLQRRLQDENTNFQTELSQTREGLAHHYLVESALSGTQIALLLGFDDPNSFFRAFHQWVGDTPEAYRARLKVMGIAYQ